MSVNIPPSQNISQPANDALTAIAYAKKTSAPQTAIDWQFALRDPLTTIGREYWAQIFNRQLDEAALIKFQECLAFTTLKQQKQLAAQTLCEDEYEEELERSQLLQAWANEQLNKTPTQADLPAIQILQLEITELLEQIARYTAGLLLLIHERNAWNHKWHRLHQAHAEQIIDGLIQNNTLDPAELAVLKNKRDQLIAAFIPARLDHIFRINPHIAKKMREILQDKNAIPPVFANFSTSLSVIGELNFHANWTAGEELLTGAALLAAIKRRRSHLKLASVALHSPQHGVRTSMLQTGAHLYTKLETIGVNLNRAGQNAQNKINALQSIAPTLIPRAPRLRIRNPNEIGV
ncbi:MAG: hypothetical protein ACD_45C00146G0002 [uncultured bacterium]|nr:MAG: hypothetical protein ACD_45C00146G0002 [uncultured bacterium]OGT55253.1 MAG: hypothetical protein A3F43_03275 [Gammaproteobacteria bacterium RIFCSPHIGHO2_12_FULL_42_10]